ncbi:MAG: BrnT family toxin, partial [Lysobacterales bacterium]
VAALEFGEQAHRLVNARHSSNATGSVGHSTRSKICQQTLRLCKSIGHPYNVQMIAFEWDSAKAASNFRKHGVSFEDARSVFYDEFAVQFDDDLHRAQEERFLLLGMSSGAQLLLVCHCERAGGDVIRIISARKATKHEASFYGQ